MKKVILREITNCTKEQQKAVRGVRNQPNVRKFMYSDHEIGETEHFAWIERLKTDDTRIVFVVLLNDVVSGVFVVDKIDWRHKKAEWGSYLSENTQGMGLGSVLKYTVVDFIFGTLGMQKLNSEIIATNQLPISIDKKFGFTEEGTRRENIIKEGKRVGVCLMGMTQAEWLENKALMYEKYKERLAQYDLSVEYTKKTCGA